MNRNYENIETTNLKLGEFNAAGDAVATYRGVEISVFGGIPGEEVTVQIHRYKKRGKEKLAGIVVDVNKISEHRIPHPCPYFGPCTGCQWQHIDYPYQLILKRSQVTKLFQRYPELSNIDVQATVPSPGVFEYRNHARFTVRKQGYLGFVNRITRKFIQVDHCMLMTKGINKILTHLQGKVMETSQLSIRHGVNTNEWLIQPAIKNTDVELLSGQTHYREVLKGRSFRVASPSFFQVNTLQAEVLTDLVTQRCNLNPSSRVVDAYAGVGTFTALLAENSFQVIAIEESAAAIKDASINLAGLENVKFIESKTEDAILNLPFTPDAVVIDPPRAGCHIKVLESVLMKMVKRIVYVSCDPDTLARDLSILVKGGYKLIDVQPVDMFPQTHHVECIATLIGRSSH